MEVGNGANASALPGDWASGAFLGRIAGAGRNTASTFFAKSRS